MKKIASKLIDYGIEFQYKCIRPSEEIININCLASEIFTYKNKIFYKANASWEIFKIKEANFQIIADKLEKKLVEEISSFKI
jgi:hypothetical protein